MAIKNTKLGGTDWSEVAEQDLLGVDLNDTFDASVDYVNRGNLSLKQIISNNDYTDTNDLLIALSSTRLIAYDSSAEEFKLSTNGGTSWSTTQASIGSGMNFTIDVNTVDPNYAICFDDSSSNTVWYTSDAGSSWSQVTVVTNATAGGAYSITDSGRIYWFGEVSSINPSIRYTDNDGSSWTTVPNLQSMINTLDIFTIISPKDGYICYDTVDYSNDAYIGYTLNGGTTWTDSVDTSTSGNDIFAKWIYIDDDNYILDVGTVATISLGKVMFNGDDLGTIQQQFSTGTKNILQFNTSELTYITRYSSTPYSQQTIKYLSDESPLYRIIPTISISSNALQFKRKSLISGESILAYSDTKQTIVLTDVRE